MQIPLRSWFASACLVAATLGGKLCADDPSSVIFIDPRVDDRATLLAGMPTGAEIRVLDAHRDGLAQIASYVAGRRGIQAIHILSHGAKGRVELGSGWLDQAGLAAHRHDLAVIGRSLSADGDILLYGCQVGADGAGVDFIQSWAATTGADVAASTNLTGAKSLGGDWVLETQAGNVETAVPFAVDGCSDYASVLAAPSSGTTTFGTGGNDNPLASGAGNGGVTAANARSSGWDITVTTTTATTIDIAAGDLAVGTDDGIYYVDNALDGEPLQSFRVASNSGDIFDLQACAVTLSTSSTGDNGTTTLTVTGYRSGAPVSGASESFVINISGGQSNLETLDVSSNSNFVGVDAFVITNTAGFSVVFVGIDNINVLDVRSPNTAPAISNLNGDSVAWAGVGSTVALDSGGNASLTDTELGALNGGNGNWSGASLTVQRSTAIAADTFGFNTSGALFTVSGTSASGNLQSGGQTFAAYTNSGGVLTVNATSSGTTATTALVNDVARHINYRNDTPAGDATIRFTLHDGTVAGTVANVTVTSDTIYVTNTTDTATINAANGVSFSEAVAIAAADATGSQTIVFDSSLAATALTVNSVSLNESLTFDMDAASGMSLTSGTITLGAATTQSFTLGTGDTASITGAITGSGALTKAGAGGLTLSAVNAYSGATNVSAGTLTVSGGDAISSNSSVTVASGATLALSNSETIGNLSGAGAITLGSNTLTSIITADTTFSGGISGTGGLSVSQSGAATFALTLSGTNTYTGNTTAVNFGWLKLNGDASVSSSSALRANGNSIITLQSDQTVGSLASNNAGASIQLGSFTLSAGSDNSSTTVSGVISGTGNLVKQGSGTLTLAGTNTYSGTTTVSAGTLSIASDSNLGSNTLTLAAGSTLGITGATTVDNAVTLSGAATIQLDATATLSGSISGSSSLTKTGSGTLTLSNTGNESTLTGGMTISAGTVSISDDDHMAAGTLTLNGGTLSLDGPTVFDNNIDLAASSTINSGGNAIASGVISGAGALTKTGSLSLQLTNSNTYTGSTTVSAGYLLANNANSLGTTAGGTGVASGATLYLSGSFTLAEALSLSGTGTSGNGAIYAPSGNSIITGQVTLTGNTTIVQDGDLTFSGGITDGAGSYSLSKQGTGALILSGTASYDGTTTISSGDLSIGSDSHIGGGALTLATGTTLAVTGATTIDNAIALSGGTATVTTSANTTFSGNITGAGGLTKTGASTLTLSGTDSYSGATNVNAGTLLVDGALTATSNTTVASGAMLGGSGSISSNVTVNSGGTLFPGASTGTLTINGDLAMASGSTLAVEINGTTAGTGYDQVIVNGTVDVSGATLSATHGYTAGSGDTYTIIVNDAADAVTGSFSGVSEGATVTAGGNSTVLTTSYIGATGNDITLTAPVMPVVTSVSSSTPNGTYKIGDTISVSVTFDMAVFVSGGTPTLLLETGTVDRTLNYVAGSGSTTLVFDYTVQAGDLSADLDYASTSALALNGSTIQDALNNNANLTLASPGAAGSLGANKALVIDGVRPTASVVVADTALAAGETTTATITFSEAVTGLTTGDFTVANGVLNSLASGDGGITWTATLTPTASITDASNLITLDNTGVSDAAGNSGSGTTDSNNYAMDTLRPTAAIVVADTLFAVGETSLVTITFNEAVTGFANGDLIVANGTLTAVSSSDGGITWTATLTPTASLTDASNLITLDNTGVTDAAGNTGTGTTDSNNYAIDGVRPTASVVVADTALAAGETSLVTITFSEAATGLATGDFAVANGALSGLSSGDGGITWTATLTPATSIEDTSNVITLANTGVADAAGNAGTGTTNSNNYAIDTLRPTATVVVADNALTVGETSLVTITFNEGVTGFANADLTIVNGTLTAVSSLDGGITWTATLTPTAGLTDATNLITLDNTGVTDAAGNTGTGTTDSNNYAIDTQRPTATVVVADTTIVLGETSLVTITFSEAVTGFTNADLTIPNGTLSAVSSSDGGITWTATFTPTAGVTDTTNVITLDNTGVTDAAGNTGTGTTDSNNFVIDNVVPGSTSTPDLAAASDSGSSTADNVTNDTTPTFMGTAEADSTLTILVNSVSSGTTTANGSGAWSFTIGSALAEGTFAITARSTDTVGNSSAESAALSVTIDTTAPVITSSTTANGVYDAAFTYTITASGTPASFDTLGLPSGLSIAGSTGIISGTPTLVGVHNVTVSATDSAGNTGTSGLTLTIARADQTISFAAIASAIGGTPVTLSATASSGLPVTFTLSSGPASLSGSTVTPSGIPGIVTVVAHQAGNASYSEAPDVTRTFAVASVRPVVAFGSVTPGTATPGGIAAQLATDGAALVLIGHIPGQGGFVLQATPDATGAFVATTTALTATGTTPITWTFHGQILGSGIVGTIDELPATFTLVFDPVAGPTAAVSGYYITQALDTTTGTMHTIVGTDEDVYVLVALSNLVTGEDGTIDGSTGELNVDLGNSSTVEGDADGASHTLSASLISGSSTETNFSGLQSGVERTDRMINLSSRARVAAGDGVTITGFVLGGTQPQSILLRAVGPGLAALQVNGTLADPRLTLMQGGAVLATNDDWGTATNASDIVTTSSAVGAFPLGASSKDAALLVTLNPGIYTAVIDSAGAPGVALAEIYDVGGGGASSYQRLLNISTRGYVGAGDQTLIGGLVVTGNAPKRVLVRGVGPKLAAFGVSGVLTDPRLTIYQGSSAITQNDDWSTGANTASDIAAAATATGAFAFDANSKDAAILITLAPGIYTAHVNGVGGATGIALVEVYEMP